jgi:hypothetical protein
VISNRKEETEDRRQNENKKTHHETTKIKKHEKSKGIYETLFFQHSFIIPSVFSLLPAPLNAFGVPFNRGTLCFSHCSLIH